MIILSEAYIFYADVYFLQNFIIKISVLYFVFLWSKTYEIIMSFRGGVKICVAGMLSTFFEMAMLLSEVQYNFLMILIFFLEIPWMVSFVLGRSRAHKWKLIVSGYIFTMIINAVLEVLWNIWGENGGYIAFLTMACCIVFIGIGIWKREIKINKGLYEIVLIHVGNQIVTQGLYDSGNRLIDPYTYKGVHIIPEKLLKELGVKEDKKVCVPYHSLGNESGMIEVYYIDKMCIYKEKEIVEQMKCPLGVTKDNLFKDKNYEVILNEEVF